jgi:hypothetical protein
MASLNLIEVKCEREGETYFSVFSSAPSIVGELFRETKRPRKVGSNYDRQNPSGWPCTL